MKRILYAFLRTLISVGLIALLLYLMRGNYNKIITIFKQIKGEIFALSVFAYIATLLVTSLRVKMIILTQGLALSFMEAVNLSFIGIFFNNFLPTSIGGDVVKAYYVSRAGKDRTSAFASIFMDRFLGLVTMIALAAISLVVVGDLAKDRIASRIVYVSLAVAVISFTLLFHKGAASRLSPVFKLVRPLEERLKKLYHTLHSYKNHRQLLIKAMGLSVFSQILYFWSVSLLALSVGANVGIPEIFLRVPIVAVLSLLPSINGLGVREGAIVLLFSPLIGRENAFAVSILMLATLMIISLIGGLIYAMSPQFKGIQKEEAIA